MKASWREVRGERLNSKVGRTVGRLGRRCARIHSLCSGSGRSGLAGDSRRIPLLARRLSLLRLVQVDCCILGISCLSFGQ